MTKININTQTERQAYSLLRTLLETRKGLEFDAISARNEIKKLYGIDADHHKYSEILDEMSRCGLATVTRPGGFTRYIIN